ncbi:ABC transporter permease subunit/CPBP intramembrane protease [Allorhodopirellula heiligendammensis]|uniref:Inner membrane transport permease YbhS n=1 Tax=Allorhodopirellula heiligendammensis TaxID=2714739 RepID=A0A5C6C4S2_9BACT|nr:ABC transporter permease subunit/CPBP intramembrane protease [Allorhodopirellula heiligendammensis]TWU18334.1 Inner membrane transport permease YbhS [Allorhodopirellula heiligendammensis]
MNLSWSRLARLSRKELRETLRDRRTILTLVMMPLLVYPLLSMAMNRFLISSAGPGTNGFVVGVGSEQESEWLQSLLLDQRSHPPESILQASGGALADFNVVVTPDGDPNQSLLANELDVAAELTITDGEPSAIEVTAFAGDQASQSARRILIERLHWLRMQDAERIMKDVLPEFTPFEVTTTEIGEPQSGNVLASIIPLVLVLMTITGAVYPAIDLTAGERERGTMEALMASPVPRWWLLLAKYIAVVSVALLTAVANLGAMFVTLTLTGLMSILVGEGGGLGFQEMGYIFLLLVLFSAFFAAVLLSLTSFARSFKEAQAYLIPVMLLALAPAMLSLMPGINLTGPLAVAPLLNIVLLAREILAGDVHPLGATVAVVSTLCYAAGALAIAAKLFGSDAVNRTSDRSIGSLFRRPELATTRPSVGEAGMVIALLLPASFVVSNSLMQWIGRQGSEINVPLQLTLNAVSLIATFGLIPLAATLLGKHRLASTYRLNQSNIGFYIGAAVMSLGAWAFAYEALVLADQWKLALLNEEQLERTRGVLEKWKTISPVLLLSTLALAPAVIEELCFRGYLFSAFRSVLRPWPTIMTTAVLFGLFHVFVGSTLLIERFLPTTLLGIALGWVAYRSGSVLPGMLMHFLHNGSLELVGRYHDKLTFLGAEIEGNRHLPPLWLVIAGGCLLTGILIVHLSPRSTSLEAAKA